MHMALDDTFTESEEKSVPLHIAAHKFLTTIPGTWAKKVTNPINLLRFWTSQPLINFREVDRKVEENIARLRNFLRKLVLDRKAGKTESLFAEKIDLLSLLL